MSEKVTPSLAGRTDGKRRRAVATGTLVALLTALVAFSLVTLDAPAAKATENDGYIGCSMTVNSINGYRSEGGTRFWSTTGYRIGGGILGRWSDTASAWWTEYDQQVAGFGAPTTLLFMACAGKNGIGVSNSIMTTALGIARAKAPDATIVVVGQPEYEDGHLCKILGNTPTQQQNALAKVRAAVAHAVSIGAELGPHPS